MAYWKEKVLELTPHPGEAQEPADGVLRSARGHEGPYGGAPHDGRVAEPPVEGGSVRVGAVQEEKKEADGRRREDQRPQRPAQRPEQAPSRRRARVLTVQSSQRWCRAPEDEDRRAGERIWAGKRTPA